MDSFLRSMGFSALQRAAVMRAGQVQVIRRRGSDLHIISHDIRGSSELVLPLTLQPFLEHRHAQLEAAGRVEVAQAGEAEVAAHKLEEGVGRLAAHVAIFSNLPVRRNDARTSPKRAQRRRFTGRIRTPTRGGGNARWEAVPRAGGG